MMDHAFEREILINLGDVLSSGIDGDTNREISTVRILPIMPIDARFDPLSEVLRTAFPALLIYPEDSTLNAEKSNGLSQMLLDVNVDLVILADPDDLLDVYTAAGSHIIDRLMYHRLRRNNPHDPGPPLDLERVEDIRAVTATTVARESQAAIETFTRRYSFEILYQSTTQDVQKHDGR